MIRTTNFRDLPARGRFWIEPDERARWLASELIAQDLTLHGRDHGRAMRREPTLECDGADPDEGTVRHAPRPEPGVDGREPTTAASGSSR